MPDVCPMPDPDPYFDPVVFFAECGDMAEVADHADAGEVYRKTHLHLEPAQVVELRARLAVRGLTIVDAGADWLFDEAEEHCPVCATPRADGRVTCGREACMLALGRRELTILRGRDGACRRAAGLTDGNGTVWFELPRSWPVCRCGLPVRPNRLTCGSRLCGGMR